MKKKKKSKLQKSVYAKLPFAFLKHVFVHISSLLRDTQKEETGNIGFLRRKIWTAGKLGYEDLLFEFHHHGHESLPDRST